MKKTITLMAGLFVFCLSAFAQYANTQEPELKKAKTVTSSGYVTVGIGAAVWLAGNVVCMVEQNKYTNSHTSSASVQEIYDLNKEAKKQPGYKRGQAMEIGGFAGLLAGCGIAMYGINQQKKLQNSKGDTVAYLSYAATPGQLGLALSF